MKLPCCYGYSIVGECDDNMNAFWKIRKFFIALHRSVQKQNKIVLLKNRPIGWFEINPIFYYGTGFEKQIRCGITKNILWIFLFGYFLLRCAEVRINHFRIIHECIMMDILQWLCQQFPEIPDWLRCFRFRHFRIRRWRHILDFRQERNRRTILVIFLLRF